MDDLTTQVLSLADPEHILSFLVALMVIGFGRWFSHSGWPWLTEYLDQRREELHEIEMKQIMINQQLLDVLGGLREEIGGFRAVQEQISATLLMAMKGNGK